MSNNGGRIYPGLDDLHQDKYDRFEDWLRENGAQFDMVGLRELVACCIGCSFRTPIVAWSFALLVGTQRIRPSQSA
jgi:hypothetical protein